MKLKDVFQPDRVLALSDGVFATMLTVLVLDLKVPIAGSENFLDALRDSLPRLEAWAVSFFVIGVFWIIHHNLLSVIPRTNTIFNYINLLLLLCISTVPWIASLLGTYSDNPWAVVLFSGMIGLADEMDINSRGVTTLLLLRVPLIALLSIGLVFISRPLGLWVWLMFTVLGVAIRSQCVHVRMGDVSTG